MISVSEAKQIVFSNLYKSSIIEVDIKEAVGEVLMEEVLADRDFPPFDRVTMDGIVINYEAFEKGNRSFAIESVQAAGMPQNTLKDISGCIEIMTGAVRPENSDTVIRYEDIEFTEVNGIRIATLIGDDVVKSKGQNVHKKGTDRKASSVLIRKGVLISPAEVAVMATVGRSTIKVAKKPRVAIISSGDELVDVNETPAAHQIRKSNSYALYTAVTALKVAAEMFHLKDNKQEIYNELKLILSEFDVLILSGGVSKGKFDFIPAVLTELNVNKLFHKVKQRPGKPFFFGVAAGNKTIFALPGNPVSTFSGFYHYIKPWLMQSLGMVITGEVLKARLTDAFNFKPNLSYFLQVKVSTDSSGELLAFPIVGKGSGDFANLLEADGFLELPYDKLVFEKGEAYPLTLYRYL